MTQHSNFGVKVIEPVRGQSEIHFSSPDGDLPAGHLARALDRVVGTLDLGPFLNGAKSIKGLAGRPVLSPRMMLVLWLYAIIDGVAAATEIERLTTSHVAYRWIVGDLRPCHDVISRFRVSQSEAFSKALNEILAQLLRAGVLDLDVVAQDGTRLRASAGSASFRTAPALEECREHARLHLHAVLAQADDPELSQTMKIARLAKARDYQERVEAAIVALETLPKEVKGPKARKGERRASTTDPDARNMKMGDGGFRPAYNIQLAVAGKETGGPRTIVGIQVTNVGSDMGSLTPMANDVEARTGQLPGAVIADTNHFKRADMRAMEERGIHPIVPPPRPRPTTATGEQRISVDDWRKAQMSPEDQQIYRRRASLSELANAVLKGTYRLDRLLVRTLPRVTSTILLYSLCFTLHQNLKKLTGMISG
jgi:transposase